MADDPSWVHIEGMFRGVTRAERAIWANVSRPPEGTNGPAAFGPLGPSHPGIWRVQGDLRDLGIINSIYWLQQWFAGACREMLPASAEFKITGDDGKRYEYSWDPAKEDAVLVHESG